MWSGGITPYFLPSAPAARFGRLYPGNIRLDALWRGPRMSLTVDLDSMEKTKVV
jgi:hypothetical protein